MTVAGGERCNHSPPATYQWTEGAHDADPGYTCGTRNQTCQSIRAGCAAARPQPLDSGSRRAADLSAALAGKRSHGGAGAHGHPRPGRHGLCRSRRPARHLRSLRHHRPTDRLRHLWAEPDPGAGAGLVAGGHHRRHDRAAGGRRPRSPGGAGRHARPPHRRAVHARRAGALWLHHGFALQAHPPGLSQRHCAHRPRRPAAQAAGLLVERRKSDSRNDQPGARRCARHDQLGDLCDRRRVPGHRLDLQALVAQDSRRADRRGRCDDRGGRV